MKNIFKNRIRFYNFTLFLLLSILFICVYTYTLQHTYATSILENDVKENCIRTDAMHKGVQGILTREDFSEIQEIKDMNSPRYQKLQAQLNEIRNMNSTRYFYTAKRNSEGKLIYLVDGLDLGAKDFAFPGSYIEDEMIPFIAQALEGKTVYSQKIIDTTWGHIFTACYPVRAKDNPTEIIGALCIEMDMEPTYTFIKQRKKIAFNFEKIGSAVIVVFSVLCAMCLKKQQKMQKKQHEILEKAVHTAASASRAKSTFLFNMSHDIRTPMNAIIGYTELAKRHLTEPERLSEYMKNIGSCGQKMLSLINNVLDLARIENDKIIIEESATNIEQSFDSCITMFITTTEKKQQTITKSVNLDYKYLFIDDSHFSEIVMNILSNAIKYTGAKGKIDCLIYQEKIEREGWCNLVLSISDNGIGMSEEFQKHIFEAFSRERSTTASGIEGTGLGMGIVKKLVDLMHGSVNIKSKLGEGSTVTVIIPCRIAKEEDTNAKRALINFDESALVGKRILLAEDNDLNAQIAIELLSEEGLLIERADDGVSCIEMLEKADADYYDLILMDIQMPILNGYDTALKIRRMNNPLKASIPIVAMTANAFSEDRKKALESGMNDHVAKPIDMNILLPVIQKYI